MFGVLFRLVFQVYGCFRVSLGFVVVDLGLGLGLFVVYLGLGSFSFTVG